MTFSHRDHRARRELRHLYLGFAGAIGVLAAIAIVFPNVTVRLLAVGGLAVAGAVYIMAVDRLSAAYQRDLAAVRAGRPVSGSVRAEVYHEVGFERNREDDWLPSPNYRRPDIGSEPPRLESPGGGAAATSALRSDPPSDGS
jgi:hypothetical protein